MELNLLSRQVRPQATWSILSNIWQCVLQAKLVEFFSRKGGKVAYVNEIVNTGSSQEQQTCTDTNECDEISGLPGLISESVRYRLRVNRRSQKCTLSGMRSNEIF